MQTKISSPKTGEDRKKRLQGEYTLLHQRRKSIRDHIKLYMTRVLYFMIHRYQISNVKVENLTSLTPRGNRGFLAKLITDMIKQLGAETSEGTIKRL